MANATKKRSVPAQRHRAGSTPPQVLEALQRHFEDSGLNGYQARALLALLQVGSARATELSRLSGVPRTSVYLVLEDLHARRLAEPLPGKVTVWVTPGRDEVLERLSAAEKERLRGIEARKEEARKLLSQMAPEAPSAVLPCVHIVSGAEDARAIYERLLRETKDEILVFNRAPYSWPAGKVNQTVLDALGRGVKARALYESHGLDGPEAELFRREHEAYMDAGVEARVVPALPIKLAVFDGAAALVAMGGVENGDTGYPTNLHIDHPGYASAHRAIFEQFWATGKPYERLGTTGGTKS